MATEFSELIKNEPIFPDTERIEGEKLKGKTFEIKAAEFLPSSFGGDFAIVLISMNKKEYSCSIGSKVVVDQLKKIKDKLPVKATLSEKKSKDGRMYQTLI